jgi:hypothetical protein
MEKPERCPVALLLLLSQTGVAAISANYATGTPALAQEVYQTLNFGTTGTFLTGIRGDNIVGNYVIPGTSATGGLLYRSSTITWTPFPVATASGTNFPGSTSSSPYGPSFGSGRHLAGRWQLQDQHLTL